MPKSDQEIIQEVIQDWRSRAGVSVVTPCALAVITQLQIIHRASITVNGTCNALEELSKVALQIHDQLKRLHTSENPPPKQPNYDVQGSGTGF